MADENYVASLKQLSYGEEAVSWGTAAATKNLWVGLVQKFDAKTAPVTQPVRSFGGGRNVAQFVKTVESTTFNLSTFLQHGKLFQYLLGNSTDAGASPYTHTMDLSLAVPSFTLVHTIKSSVSGGTDIAYDYTGCKVGKCTLEFPDKGIVTANFEGTCKLPVAGSAQTVTAATTAPFLTAQTTVEIDVGSGYVEVPGVKVARAIIDTGLATPNYMNGQDIKEQFPNEVNYNIELDKDFKNSTYYAAMLANTDLTGIRLTLTRSASDKAVFTFTGGRILTNDLEGGITGPQTEAPRVQGKSLSLVFTDSNATY